MEEKIKSLYLVLQKKNYMVEYEVTKVINGKCYAGKTVMIVSLQTLAAILFSTCAVINTVNVIKGTWVVQGRTSIYWNVVFVQQNQLLLRISKKQH